MFQKSCFAQIRTIRSHDFSRKVHCHRMDTAVCSLSEDSIEKVQLHSKRAWRLLRELNLLCDVVLQTEDGGYFVVHRAVMSVCSWYFKSLFTSKITKDTQKRISFCVPGVSGAVLREMVEFAYNGRAHITADNAADLLIGADQLNVLEMLRSCTDFIRKNLSYDNCLGIKDFASTFFCFELEKEARRLIMRNFVDVTQSQEYFELPIEKVILLLNSDNINVRTEELVWEAGLRWIDYNPHSRKKFAPSIMRCVRLGLLDTQYFMDKVKQHTYVESNEVCKPVVIETLRFLWDLELIGQKTDEVETPFLATPRIPYAILFTIGGWSGNSPTNLIETYDTKADRWIEVDERDPDGPRAYHKLAVIGFNIYVIGGFNGPEYFTSCRCFNAVTKEWTDIAPMHSKRCYVSVATLDNSIYAMGGFDGYHRQNTAERYDVRENQWTFIAPMNAQRSDASAATLNGLIYVVGGFNGSECLSSCEYYNPTTGQWTVIPSMRHRRSGVSVIAYHGLIYALGGFNGVSRLGSGEKYDPDSNQWSEVPDMFNPRSNFAIEVMDDMIFVIGGFNGSTTIFHVECYDDRTKEWYEATDMNEYRSALAACVVPGLPNVEDYVHKNRRGLMEEKRQKLLQQRVLDVNRNNLPGGTVVQTQPRFRPILEYELEALEDRM